MQAEKYSDLQLYQLQRIIKCANVRTMFAERLVENLSCGKIWREKPTICLAFPNIKLKMVIIYYEVNLFQGESHYYGGVDGFYF